jgi:hypothetical protein
MKSMDRRRFLLATAATAASLKSFAQPVSPQPVKLTLHPDQPGPTIPRNFVGLSYETQQLTDPNFFSTANTGLIAQLKALTPHGVLRLGGNTSDVGWWKPTPESKQPPLPPKVVIVPLRPDEQPFQKLAYSVTPEAVTNLRAFLDATGWTCLYGINLGTSTPERAAEEAAFVAKTLGHKLEYFQIGNEPDIFTNRFRVKATWTADAYLDEWLASVKAVLAVVPNARFGLPDTSGNPKWSSAIADRLSALPDHSFVAAISHHHYFGGPPSNPKVNIDALLHPQPSVLEVAATTKAAAAKLGTLYRMSEGNTCYRGGKPGVSDVFAASLWAADYLLTLASQGYAGVNLHGGSGKAVADSLGGTLPGELLMPDPKAPHPRPFYTPIAEIDGKYVLEPVGYGMKFAAAFQGATIIPIDFDPGEVNATAYAARDYMGRTQIAIINKDAVRDLYVDVNGVLAREARNRKRTDGISEGQPSPSFQAITKLTAASLTSTRVDLGPTAEKIANDGLTFVPRASALLLSANNI